MSFKPGFFLILLGFLALADATAAEDCDALIAQAEELRQMREHDARAGVERTTEMIEGLDAAQRRNCPAGLAQLYRARASNLTVLGQADQSLVDVNRGLEALEASGEDESIHLAALHLTAGVAHWELESHDLAIGQYLLALEFSERAGDVAGAARASGNLGNLYNTLGDFEQAREHHRQARLGFEAAGNLPGQAGTLINLAALDFREAESRTNAGLVEEARERYESALDHARQALALFEELGNPLGVSYAANNVASALEFLGQPRQSLAYHQRALDIRREVGDRMGVAWSLNTMSGALIRADRLDEAAALLEEADEYIPDDNLGLSEERARRQVELHEALGDFAEALDWQREVTRLRGRIAENAMGLRVEEMRLGFETEQREQQLELLRTEATIRQLQLDRQRFASALAITAVIGLLILLVSMVRLYRQGRRMTAALEVAARTDPLTSLSNRRDMDFKLAAFCASARSGPRRTAALILIDIDNFKEINDLLGHQRGDEILVQVASVLKSALRPQDDIARWGGEEFLVLLGDCDLDKARVIAERIRSALVNAGIEINGKAVTVTLGVSVFGNDEMSDAALLRADDALYRGKAGGKNQVVVAA